MRTHAFILTILFWRERRELLSLLPSCDILVHGEEREAENIMMAGLED
jgi:hypothetical protein